MANDLTALGGLLGRLGEAATTEPGADAEEAVAELFPEGEALVEFVWRFSALIALSSSIAAFGLLADSAAVVIGAMLVAPLMTPILAAAAATVKAENRHLLTALLVLTAGTLLAIAVGAGVSAIANSELHASSQLPGEIESRAFPGLLDLGIAVTAGAAAGYILPRRSATSALPGVGIAVALVPPLAAVGITLQAGFTEAASNAFLLYVTNLAAIIFAASFMLVLAGFRPRQRQSRKILAVRVAITVGAVLAVAIPLSVHTRAKLSESRLRAAVTRSVETWDETATISNLVVNITDGRAEVEVVVSGPSEPQDPWHLAEDVSDRFGGPVDLDLLYEQDRKFQVSVR